MAEKKLKADTLNDVAEKKPKKKAEEPVKEAAPAPEQTEEVTETSEEAVAETPEAEVVEEAVAEAPKKPGRKPKNKIEDMTPSEQVRIRSQRGTYSVEKATKEEKSELYTSEKIFREAGDEAVETPEEIRRREWLEIISSAPGPASNRKILKGKIISITEIESASKDEPDYVPEFMAKVEYGQSKFIINIPSYALYYYNYPKLNAAMALDIQRNMQHRIGAEIDFTVKYAREKDGYVIGDRLEALSMRGCRNYLSQNGLKPQIIEGMIVQSRIMAISRTHVIVDAAGADITIPLEEISWLYVADAREFNGVSAEPRLDVGGYVNVKILSIDTEKVRISNSQSYTLIKATGSIRQCTPNPKLKYFKEFNKGDIYAGTVTGVTESGIYVNLSNRMDCLCKFAPTGRRNPILGEQVVVRINSKDEEKMFIYGSLR